MAYGILSLHIQLYKWMYELVHLSASWISYIWFDDGYKSAFPLTQWNLYFGSYVYLWRQLLCPDFLIWNFKFDNNWIWSDHYQLSWFCVLSHILKSNNTINFYFIFNSKTDLWILLNTHGHFSHSVTLHTTSINAFLLWNIILWNFKVDVSGNLML